MVLIEFSEYQCPFCKRHADNTTPTINKEYVETGKIRHVFSDYPLGFHKLAPKAAEAAHCAGDQDKFWEMSAKLFENTREIGPEHLVSKAESLGLDMAKFNECLESGKHAEGVKQDTAIGAKFGVTGTPSFILAVSNGDDSKLEAVKLIRGAQQLEVFKRELDAVLAKQE